MSEQVELNIHLDNNVILAERVMILGDEKVYLDAKGEYYIGWLEDGWPRFRPAGSIEVSLIKRLLDQPTPQQRLIALLDELNIKNWVSGTPRQWNEPKKGWQVFIVQDDIEEPGYYRYIQFEFNLKGEFVDYEIGEEWKEPEPPI